MRSCYKYKAIAHIRKPNENTEHYSALGKSIKGSIRRLANVVPANHSKNFPYTVYSLNSEGALDTVVKYFAGHK